MPSHFLNKVANLGSAILTLAGGCFCSGLIEGVHLTLPPDIISVQVKSRNMLHHGSVGASLKQNKRNLKKLTLTPNPNP